MKGYLIRHVGHVVSGLVAALLAIFLTAQGVPAPQAQAIGQQVGQSAGEAAQRIADEAGK